MIVIRNCRGFEEFEACVQLQVETWGYDPADIIPRRAIMLAQKIGGQVVGAFDTELPGVHEAGSAPHGTAAQMIGFAMGLPGIKPEGDCAERHYIHSHMLAVREGYRNHGLGARLKLEQRREALSRGIHRMEWTFDPLEIKNAFLNIHKLGAVIRQYRENFYGVSSSRLQAGLPTDRLVAEWYLNSPHVTARIEGQPSPAQDIRERIVVPAAIYQWKAEGSPQALTVQLENRLKFQQAFARGFAVVGFHRDPEGNGVYELASFTPAIIGD